MESLQPVVSGSRTRMGLIYPASSVPYTLRANCRYSINVHNLSEHLTPSLLLGMSKMGLVLSEVALMFPSPGDGKTAAPSWLHRRENTIVTLILT